MDRSIADHILCYKCHFTPLLHKGARRARGWRQRRRGRPLLGHPLRRAADRGPQVQVAEESQEVSQVRQSPAGQNPNVSCFDGADVAEHFDWFLIHCSMNSKPANSQADTLYVNPSEALGTAF